jgi:hypothetical protein
MRRLSLPRGVERLHVDDHHVDAGVGREALQVVQLLGVVDEEARLLLVVSRKCSAVISSDLATPSRMAMLGTTMMNLLQP